MVSSRGIRAGAAYVELYANDNRLVRGLKRAQRRLKAFAAGVSQIGAKMAKLSAVMATPFIAGAKVFADFEQQMANVSTMLDDPEKHMARFTKAIRDMSVEFGESTEALAGGLYDILSASIPAEKALDVLAVAVRAAKAGMTDTKTAADAITTILNSYGLAAEHAGEVSDLLFSVVKRGKTTFAELAPQIGMVASTASSAGVGLDELGAALATLTRAGVKTENAVTAVNQIIMAFLKPSKEAAKYARQLGFEMSSVTLQTEGIEGVFKRISKLPPDAIAKLFPNVRALRGVIPALKNMTGFTDDIAAMAKRAGATETAYRKMTKTLTHSFNQLKQSALVALSVLGEALAEPLAKAAKAIRRYAKAVAEVIAKNKAMVVTIAKVIGVVGLVGVSLMVVGYAVSAISSIFGALAAVITGVGTAIGVFGAILGAILSPIGLVITAVVALGAYILYATGAAAKALGWLGDRFTDLKADATEAYQGIADALAAGDIGLAAKILWLTLKIQWQKGINVLQAAWLKFKNFFVKLAFGAFYGAQAAWELGVHSMTVVWIEGVAAMRKVWAGFTAWHARTVETTANWMAKRWIELQGLFDKTIDVQFAKKHIDQQSAQRFDEIEQDRSQAVKDAEQQRKATRQLASQEHEKNMADIGQQYEDKTRQLEDEYNRKITKSEADLARARKEWQQAIAEARKKRQAKETDAAPGKMQSPEQLLDKVKKSLAGLGDTLNRAAAIGVKGTFYAAEARGLGAGGAADRTAKATEETARNTKKLVNEARRGGLTFA